MPYSLELVSDHGSSEAVLSELVVELLEILAAGSLGSSLNLLLLLLPELLRFLLSLLLKTGDEILSGPADLAGELSKNAELSVGLEAEDLESVRDNQSLFLVVGERNAVEDLQAAESSGTSGSLVGEHASHDSPEDA